MDNQNEVFEQLMSVKEASELWQLSPSRIRQLAIAGKIVARKFDSEWILLKIQPNPKTYRKRQ